MPSWRPIVQVRVPPNSTIPLPVLDETNLDFLDILCLDVWNGLNCLAFSQSVSKVNFLHFLLSLQEPTVRISALITQV